MATTIKVRARGGGSSKKAKNYILNTPIGKSGGRKGGGGGGASM